MTTVTQWFELNVRPIRYGVYETCFEGSVGERFGYSKWSKDGWSYQRTTVEEAARELFIGAQDKHWRGLAEQPK